MANAYESAAHRTVARCRSNAMVDGVPQRDALMEHR